MPNNSADFWSNPVSAEVHGFNTPSDRYERLKLFESPRNRIIEGTKLDTLAMSDRVGIEAASSPASRGLRSFET